MRDFLRKTENYLFKKIELWILLIIIVLFLIFSYAFGVLIRQGIEGRQELGSFSISKLAKPFVQAVRLPEKIIDRILKPNELRLDDSWDKERKFIKEFKGFSGKGVKKKYLLLSRYSIKHNQSIVELVNLENFEVLHKWIPDIDYFNDLIKQDGQFKDLKRDNNKKRFRIFHPIMTNDGGIIFSDNHSQLIKIDHCSNLKWQNTDHLFHHSKEGDLEQNYWVPANIYESKIKNYEKINQHNILVKINKNGKTLYKKSLLEMFIENSLDYYLHSEGINKNDIFHLNDIQPANIKSEFWNIGDLFLSLRNLSMIIQFRPSTNKIINLIHGPFFNQHDVDIINNEEISIFNNNKKLYGLGYTEIIIYNFKEKKFRKHLNNELKIENVKTPYEGVQEIMPNFETYVESNIDGRILYFDENKKLKWQFANNNNPSRELYAINWSRILYSDNHLIKIRELEKKKEKTKCLN